MIFRTEIDAETRVRAGVGVIIADASRRILLEKRSDCGLWGLPGGSIEPGESIVETAQREVKEETGLTIEVVKLLGVYSGPHHRIVAYPDNVVQLVDVLLQARILSGSLTCSAESEELQFFPPSELPDAIVPPSKEPLEDFVHGRTCLIR